MATPPDNSGKPPAPPGMPRISPALPPVSAAAPKPQSLTGPVAPKITAAGSSGPPKVPPVGAVASAPAPAIPKPPGSPGAVRPPAPTQVARQPAEVPAAPARPTITATQPVQRSDLGTQPSARTPLLAQATNPAVRGAPAAVPRPAGAPGSVPRPPGAPSGVPRPGGAPSARPPHVAPPPPPPLEVDEPVEPEATTEPTDIPAQAPTRPSFVAPAAVSAAPPLRRLIIPETGAIERVSPQQIAELKRLFGQFAQFDYFQVLQLAPTATTVEIKRAFYKESRIYHPDRIFHLDDAAAKQHFGELYRRITEAYYVLRDDAKRKKYLADLAGPERANKLRFTEASEFEQKAEVVKAREEEFGTNPKARQFFKTALADIAASKWDVALRNIKMALTFEPSNPRFKEKLALVEAKVEEQRKATHTGFTIK